MKTSQNKLNFLFTKVHITTSKNNTSIKSGRAMWKLYMVQNFDNDILEGLAVAYPLKP
jgi:hypothetical protein